MRLEAGSPVQYLKGVGPRRADALARLGVRTVGDLLYHTPHRYLDATTVTPLARARVGAEATCVGTVVTTGVLPTRRGLRVFRAVLKDESGLLECAWPGQPFLERQIKKGLVLLVTGPVRYYHGRQLIPREFMILGDSADDAPGQGRVLPVYPATEGLTNRQIRALVHQHLEVLLPLAVDSLPRATREPLGLPPLVEALAAVHKPRSLDEAEAGRRRLAFDELFDQQLVHARARFLAKRARAGIRFEPRRDLTTKLKEHLPFTLTADQRHAIRDIADDMAAPLRMHRLLMGDVGTGKTVVALFAMLLAVENDYQAALMAPTELLAEQHHRTLATLLAPLGLVPELLLGRLTAAEKKVAHARLRTGETKLVVGTHALVQESVAFQRLGLAVIDEQHRFGVEQRAALMGKGEAPDVLLLTATPIPRSLALTRYGDLDASLLRERPPGRGTIRTAVRTPSERRRVFEFVRNTALAGGQAYIVLPVIEESETADLRAAQTMATTLKAQWPDVTVGLVHGRLKATERDQVMRDFRDGKIGVLVATTVIEVGIDVANATVMVIEHPERFGLAQLHQLRGRVGRGSAASHCIVLPVAEEVPERLRAFAATDDGFAIAELDLAERRQGDLLGARQSGGVDFKVARFPDDTDLLTEARTLARAILDEDQTLDRREHRALRERVLARYPRGEALFRVG